MELADVLVELEDMEQKYLMQIVKLSHADKVIEMLGERFKNFDGFAYFPNFFDKYAGTFEDFANQISINVVFGAAYGYAITVRKNEQLVYQGEYKDYTGFIVDDMTNLYDMIIKGFIYK